MPARSSSVPRARSRPRVRVMFILPLSFFFGWIPNSKAVFHPPPKSTGCAYQLIPRVECTVENIAKNFSPTPRPRCGQEVGRSAVRRVSNAETAQGEAGALPLRVKRTQHSAVRWWVRRAVVGDEVPPAGPSRPRIRGRPPHGRRRTHTRRPPRGARCGRRPRWGRRAPRRRRGAQGRAR